MISLVVLILGTLIRIGLPLALLLLLSALLRRSQANWTGG